MDSTVIILVVIIILIIIGFSIFAYTSYQDESKEMNSNLQNQMNQLENENEKEPKESNYSKDDLGSVPEGNIECPTQKKSDEVGDRQVFNVGNNLYTYDQAQAVCKAHDGELASLEQVVDAYKQGADWCNYGWIKGQMAVYPTQKSSWEKMQSGPVEQRNDCGLPGVNGGYFENKKFLFGANCYAPKPVQKKIDTRDYQKYLVKNIAHDKQHLLVEELKRNKDQFDVLPFNKDSWSQ